MSRFKKAERKQARLRLALTGPSGAGKTYSALMLAKGIGGKIAVIDTERGSASLYSDLVDFDVLELNAPFTPEAYIEAITDAEKAGYEVLIIDSLTHEWNGKGGILEIHDSVTRTKAKGNSYVAWADVTPRHNAFVDTILQSGLHIICTMRSKSDFVLVEGANGKQVPKKVGLAPIQRDGLEYEFTAVLDVSLDGNFASASKDRTRLFKDPVKLTHDDGKRLREWLESGVSVEEQQAQEVKALTATLEQAAKQGTAKFREVWAANPGPVRTAILSDEDTMTLLQDECKKADAAAKPAQEPQGAEDDDGQAAHQQQQEQQQIEGAA